MRRRNARWREQRGDAQHDHGGERNETDGWRKDLLGANPGRTMRIIPGG
jgi:hypothetical protein